MFINIGEKIKYYREQKNVSQDDFAKYLGVTCKTVLKWETAELYPDFELIPIIANYFGISTDILLCMENFDNEDKIKEYIEKFYEKISSGNIRDAVETAREGLMHFPNEYRIKILLMHGLYLSCDRPAAIKHYSSEIIEIGEDIFKSCTVDSIRNEARRLLCLHYYEDLSDTDKAREEASYLPARKACREDMLPHVSDGEAKLSAIQENIATYTALLSSAITAYAENDDAIGAKDKIRFYELAKTLKQAIYSKKDFFEVTYSHMLLLKNLAALYMSVEEPKKALDCLKECAECAAEFDALPKENQPFMHISPLLNRLKFTKNQLQIPSKSKKLPLRDVFFNDIITLHCFDSIKYDPKMTEICSVFNNK